MLGGLGAYGPLYNVAVQISNRQPYNLYGFHANAFAEIFYAPYKDTETASPLVTSSTNNWINDVWIPLTISPDSEIGAWYLNDPELTVDVAITGGTTAQSFSTVNGATIQGSWDVYIERFSAPAPDQPAVMFGNDCSDVPTPAESIWISWACEEDPDARENAYTLLPHAPMPKRRP